MRILPILLTIVVGAAVFITCMEINNRGTKRNGGLDKLRIKIFGKSYYWKMYVTWPVVYVLFVAYWGIWYDIFWNQYLAIPMFFMLGPSFWASFSFWGGGNPKVNDYTFV